MNNIFYNLKHMIRDFVISLVELLPSSPFQPLIETIEINSEILANINYFIPFGQMLILFTAYISATLIWYVVRWGLRLVQYID